MIKENNPISVFIIDDSLVFRDYLKHFLEKDPLIKVVGSAGNAEDALAWLKDNSPDIITMDVLMPGTNGFELTKKIMKSKPTRILMITVTYLAQNDAKEIFMATEAGALAILEKPKVSGDIYGSLKIEEIRETIKQLCATKWMSDIKDDNLAKKLQPLIEHDQFSGKVNAVAIGASLGGPAALSTILSQLPPTFPAPVFIVQHIAPGFTEGLVKWLQTHSRLEVHVAKDGEEIVPGHCYVAPDKCQMEIGPDHRISLDFAPSDNLKPSVGFLFKSVAEVYGTKAVGIILTGMGRDGAQELLYMRQKGGLTIAQDENSSLVFGMPKEAIDLGAAVQVLPLNQIAHILKNLVNG